MTLHTPISTCKYDTRVERRGECVVLRSEPRARGVKALRITLTPDEAENIGADLIEAARGRTRTRRPG